MNRRWAHCAIAMIALMPLADPPAHAVVPVSAWTAAAYPLAAQDPGGGPEDQGGNADGAPSAAKKEESSPGGGSSSSPKDEGDQQGADGAKSAKPEDTAPAQGNNPSKPQPDEQQAANPQPKPTTEPEPAATRPTSTQPAAAPAGTKPTEAPAAPPGAKPTEAPANDPKPADAAPAQKPTQAPVGAKPTEASPAPALRNPTDRPAATPLGTKTETPLPPAATPTPPAEAPAVDDACAPGTTECAAEPLPTDPQSVAERCGIGVQECDDSSPPDSWLDRAKSAMKDLDDAASEAADDLMRLGGAVGQALLDNPDAVGATLEGAALATAGTAGVAGGVALSGTGAGAVAGVPAAAISGAAVVGGAGMMAAGMSKIAKDAGDNYRNSKTISTPRGSPGSLSDLNAQQMTNYQRYAKKLPAKAEDVQVEKLANGGVRLSAKVPADNIPGSYAEYTKIVDREGKTTLYVKDTYGPDGSIIHSKIK